jgi:hypothetical protein
MLNFISKALGLSKKSRSSVESVVFLEGEYFVVEKGKNSATGVDRQTARQQIERAGDNPSMIDKLP